MALEPEKILENWNKLVKFVRMTGEHAEKAEAMIEDLGERLLYCPASSKVDYHNAFPGGLVDHSLRVLSNASKLSSTFGWSLPKSSLIISCLMHDIGKVGDHEKDYYVPSTDQWRKDKLGEVYTYNQELTYMSVPDRSVFLCAHYGLKLTREEFLAIKLNDGFVVQENKPYCLKEPLLAHVVMTADYISTMQEKNPNWSLDGTKYLLCNTYHMNKNLLLIYLRLVINEDAMARVPNQLISPNGSDEGSSDDEVDETEELEEFSGTSAVMGYSAPLGMNPDKFGRKKNKSIKLRKVVLTVVKE